MQRADRRVPRAVTALLILIGWIDVSQGVDLLDTGALSFEDRVRCAKVVEEVYWRHRIWPAENPGAKPALGAVLPDAQIRERVTTDLRKSAALEVHWQRPLTGEQLQAEMNRMVHDTRDPGLLRELFAVLDDDPLLVAECLARPVLVDRLLRDWYTHDDRFHGALRERAAAALATHPNDATRLRSLGGEYQETESRLALEESDVAGFDARMARRPVIALSADEWCERIELLASLFGIEPQPEETDSTATLLERLPLRVPSRIVEETDRFEVTLVLSRESDRLRVASVTWSKRPFDTWWMEEGQPAVASAGATDLVLPPYGGYELPAPAESGCTVDTWADVSLPSGLTGREPHTAVWTGTEMIVWGGGSYPYQNSGRVYDPAIDSWTETSTGFGVPTGRYGHTAVWTGVEMIVWGGRDANGYTYTGGQYNPLSDSWTATAEGDDAPTGRYWHSAVWTGEEMIVWGGGRVVAGWFFQANTGARYDPVTRTWVATSTGPGTPVGRAFHSVVWTGEEMIVWGGARWVPLGINQFPVRLSSGSRYDPAVDKWTAISSQPEEPTARRFHTVVWTGTEMIVWGGYTGASGGVDSGGRYDPVTDSWTTTSTTTGVPEARYRHTAVWTGAEMIVWGGSGGLDSGGRYDPATDDWTATPTGPDGPTGRYNHTAVWTGNEMIVWGGRGAGSQEYLNSGDRYCACEGETVSTWYPDADGDGLGADSTGIPACAQPHGYILAGGDCDDRYDSCATDCTDADQDGLPACAPDCDDANPFCTTDCTDADSDTYCVTHDCDDANPHTHPGAAETNDGLDNNCPHENGYGLVDEISGECGFYNAMDRDEFSWTPQAGATSYEVARSSDRWFTTDCLTIVSASTSWSDTEPVPAGGGWYYLVRATQPNLGSWGAYTGGPERTVCP